MDRLELVVFESRKKREELSSYDSFQEEEQFERDTVCLNLFLYNESHVSFENTGHLLSGVKVILGI